MRKCLILFILISFSINLNAQETNLDLEPKKWILKWNTTAAVDGFSFPTVQFAIERKLNNYFSVQTEYGIQMYNFRKADTSYVNTSGHRVIIEGRFYFFNYLKTDKSKKRKSDGIFTGIQVFYRNNSYNHSQDYFLNESDYEFHNNLQSDTFGVKKEVYGINLCLGYQIPFKQFIIEPYTYFGVFNRKIKNINREFDENFGHIPFSINHHYIGYDLEEDSSNDFNFSFGLRIGYKF